MSLVTDLTDGTIQIGDTIKFSGGYGEFSVIIDEGGYPVNTNDGEGLKISIHDLRRDDYEIIKGKNRKPRWLLNVDVTIVGGHQTFMVEADTEEEAFELFKSNKGVMMGEELDVQGLDDVDERYINDIYQE